MTFERVIGETRTGIPPPITDILVASAILSQLPETSQTDHLIAYAVIKRMSFAPEYASFLASDYATDDYFVELLKSALDEHKPGSLYVTSSLIDGGYKSFLPYAIAAAHQIAANPTANPTYAELRDRQVATSLLPQ